MTLNILHNFQGHVFKVYEVAKIFSSFYFRNQLFFPPWNNFLKIQIMCKIFTSFYESLNLIKVQSKMADS